MRVTAEQFAWRKENRVTGAYVSQAPRGERRGRKAIKPSCDNCELETEYLFDGYKSPIQDNAELKRAIERRAKRDVMVLCSPFQTQPAKVCMRCRPPSNLEIEEILNGD